ncbi:MAG TPA: hypothetical protein VEB03_01825 [Candidatus Nanoarchaeia archaeon]|nr:hypothetical protein [Candidatus Nanoarchaeia archaeon]
MDVTSGAVTVRVTEPVTPAEVAEIEVDPSFNVVASPVLLTVAIAVFDEAHVADVSVSV